MAEQTIFPNIPLIPRTTDNSGTNIVTGLVRLSYLHVFTPQPSQQPGGKARYTVSVLVPKTDAATLALHAVVDEGANRYVEQFWWSSPRRAGRPSPGRSP